MCVTGWLIASPNIRTLDIRCLLLCVTDWSLKTRKRLDSFLTYKTGGKFNLVADAFRYRDETQLPSLSRTTHPWVKKNSPFVLMKLRNKNKHTIQPLRKDSALQRRQAVFSTEWWGDYRFPTRLTVQAVCKTSNVSFTWHHKSDIAAVFQLGNLRLWRESTSQNITWLGRVCLAPTCMDGNRRMVRVSPRAWAERQDRRHVPVQEESRT